MATFVQIYLADNERSAGGAYRKAFKRPDLNAVFASRAAAKLLKHPPVKAALEEAKHAAHVAASVVIEEAGVRFAVHRMNILERLSHLAFSDLRALLHWGPDGVTIKDSDELTDAQAFAVVEISERPTQYGKAIRIKVADKRLALQDLAKLSGLFTAEDPGKSGPDTPELVEARRATRQKFLDLLEKMAKPEPLTIEGAQPIDIVTGKNILEIKREIQSGNEGIDRPPRPTR